MDSTREQAAGFGSLPPELWVDVLSFLQKEDLERALCTCKSFFSIRSEVWRASCYRRWPRCASIVESANMNWNQVYDLLKLREREDLLVPNINSILALQPEIKSQQREILVEWLFEVALCWNLDSSLVFDAVRYLDYYLTKEVASKSSFQLIGLACLRAALHHFRGQNPSSLPFEKIMDPTRYAYISDGACTAQQVEESTEYIINTIPNDMKTLPNARMYLRSSWYNVCFNKAANASELHIYILAAWILEVGLMHLPCSSFPPSLLASSALSLSFMFYEKDPWPECMQRFIAYSSADLHTCMFHFSIAQQKEHNTGNFRELWRKTNVANDDDSDHKCAYKDEWRKIFEISRKNTNVFANLLANFFPQMRFYHSQMLSQPCYLNTNMR